MSCSTQRVDSATTVVITRTDQPVGAHGPRLRWTHAASAASVVLLDPDPEVTKGMGLPVDSHLTDLEDVAAGCRGAEVGEDFRLGQAHRAYTPSRRRVRRHDLLPGQV